MPRTLSTRDGISVYGEHDILFFWSSAFPRTGKPDWAGRGARGSRAMHLAWDALEFA